MQSMPCSNTAALLQYEHEQYVAERELAQALEDQARAGIDPIERHVDDMLDSREFYEHAADSLIDNGLIAPLLEAVMCGPYGEGAEVVREILAGLARLHAQIATVEQGGLYLPKYDDHDVDAADSMQQLRDYLACLAE